MTKRLLSLLLSAALMLGLLSACAPQGEVQSPPPSESESSPTQTEPSPTPSEEPLPSADPAEKLSAQSIVNSVYFSTFQEAGGMEKVYNLFNTDVILTDILRVDKDDCQSVGALRSSGVGTMLVVLRCTGEDAAGRVEAALRNYADGEEALREEDPTRNPSALYRQGLYLGLFHCPDPELAGEAFFSVLSTGERLDRTASVADLPAFELSDLLFRLLIEGGVCPEWRKVGNWTDPGWNENGLLTVAASYGAAPSQYEACCYAFWDPEDLADLAAKNYPCHLALFQTAGEEEAKALPPILRQTLELRLENTRKELFLYTSEHFDLQKYLEQQPGFDLEEEVDRLTRLLAGMENAQVVQSGRYAALLICEDPVQLPIILPRFTASPDTKGFFDRYVNGGVQTVQNPDPNYPDRELFTPPNEEDMSLYDTAPILSAWEKGDPAGLSEYDKEIYSAAEEILGEIITDGMTVLEKETAIYTWLTENVDYDWSHMDIMAETSRDAYGPYGGLVNQSAVCLGYATSFQLLMDMAGIECVTVVGAAFHSTGDHAWNMVKLDGKWYCVDVTWDANGRQQSGEEYEWRYFNVTSDEMAKDHQWDYANVPEAVTEGNGKA